MRRAATLCATVGLGLSAACASSISVAGEALQPYQLVRSLQLVQDRIASGDHAALPMQGKLLEMADARLRTAGADDFREPKNFRALLVYGMSGGNPATVEAAASRIQLGPGDDAIAAGVIDYLNGRPAAAIEALKPVDPMSLPGDLGAFVALVKGSLLAIDEPAQALTLLDQARLLSPGTLVEEAALRRSVGLAATQNDAARFARASTRYVENFLHSPYASQFADSFVSGVIALHMAISQDRLIDITSMMDAEREKVIYLRIARRAAIDGINDLSAFASARAEQGRGGKVNDGDPRAVLYASLSTVTSDTVADVREKLKKIDRDQLSEGDRALLDAAQAVVRELTAPPAPVARMPVAETRPAEEKKPAGETLAATALSDASDLPPVEGILSERPALGAQQPKAAELPKPVADAVDTVVAATEAPVADPSDPTDAGIADTRRKLEMIDQMLGASPR